jgi:hypothetical protein
MLAPNVPPRSKTLLKGLRDGDSYSIPDLNLIEACLLVLLDVDVDGEVGIDVSHFVLVALGDADDQIFDDGFDGAERCHILAAAVVDLDRDDVFAGQGEADGEVREVFCQFAYGLERKGILASSEICQVAGRYKVLGKFSAFVGSNRESDCAGAFKDRIKCLPRGPSTVTRRDRMWILTFSGISSCSWE